MKKHLIRLAHISLLAFISANTSHSSQNQEQTDGVLEDITISAMRFSDSIYETPASGITITSSEIGDSALSSVSEVLNRYSDVYIRSIGGGSFMGQPSLRGFGINSQSRVLVLLDGQRLNNIDQGGINWGQVQLYDVENIEVLYGAQSATYGSFAESGVIKISTKKWGKNGAKFGAVYGEYGEYSFYGNATYSDGDYYASAGANYYHNSGFFANSLNWNKSASIKAGVKLDSQNEVGLYVNVGNMFISWPGYIQANTSSQMHELFPNGLTHTEEDRVDYMTISTSWENYSAIGEGSAHLGVNVRDKYVDWIGYSPTNATNWTVSFDPKYRFYMGKDDESYIESGLDFFYDNFNADKQNSFSTEVNRFTIAPWVASKIQADDSLSFSASLRYEAAINDATTRSTYTEYDQYWNPTIKRYDMDDDELVNGFAAQIGVNYKINDHWNVYARFDQIYHYPSIDERYSLNGYGPYYTNDNLDPEHGQNYEIGTNLSALGFSFNASVFYTHLNDEIAYDQMLDMNKNIGDTDRFGTQFRIGYDFKKYAGAFTSWTFVSAKYASGDYDGEDVALVPKAISKSAIWIKPIDYVKVELNYTWAGKQYQDGYTSAGASKEKIPENYSLDLTVNIYPCKNARIFFGIANITNHINCSYATTGYWGASYWYPEAGRTIRGGLEISF